MNSTPLRRICVLAASILALSMSGCSGLLPKPPQAPPATFLLSPDLTSLGPSPKTSSRSPVTLLVTRPEPSAGYATVRMAYLERDYRLDHFADHAWVDPPTVMLEPLLVQALATNPAFGAVSSDGRGIRADLRLDTVIEAFYQDFRTRPSRARVALRIRLVDTGSGRILATRLLEDSEPAPTEDAYGGVQALNRVLARLLPEVADFAASAAPHAGKAPGADDPERAAR